MNVLIQHIETYWTKTSRGHPGATARNAVPEYYQLNNLPDKDGIFYIRIQYLEHRDFKEPLVTIWRAINDNQQREIGLDLKFERDDKLLVSKWMKSMFLKKIGKLTPGSWLKIISNERVVLEYTWAYKKHVFNIYFGKPGEINRILSSQNPISILNLETNLW